MEVINKMSNSYKIDIGYKNCLSAFTLSNENNYYICIDKNVSKLHQDYLSSIIKNATGVMVIEAIEDNKSLEMLEKILTFFNENNVDKKSIIYAIGGGIIGDIVGFAASIYMRGIQYVSIPTTLLAQVDSSIGQKVAINHFNAKNNIGSFYAPKRVVIDTYFLSTLTTRLFKEGFVELIKHGIIKDLSILHDIEKYNDIKEIISDTNSIISLIEKSLKVKMNIVDLDPLDQGERHVLNIGHTLAHAIELSDENDLYHGEAVAIGILITSYLSNKDVYEKIKYIFEKFGLIRVFNNIDYLKISSDKKKNGSTIKEVYIKELGATIIREIEIADLINEFKSAIEFINNDNIKYQNNNYIFRPSILKGTIIIPPSKSYAHRYLIAAAKARQKCTLKGINQLSDDVLVTMKAVEVFGVDTHYNPILGTIDIIPNDVINKDKFVINMNESGTSLRLLMPLLLGLEYPVLISGENKLPTRPMQTYLDIFDQQKVKYSFTGNDYLPIRLEGDIKAGKYQLAGNISSQFISGLLYKLPLLDSDSTIEITTPLESIPYVQMSIAVLKEFNIIINSNDEFTEFKISGNQVYRSKSEYQVEQDYSGRGFFEVAASFSNNDINILPAKEYTLQGDSIVGDIIKNKINFLDLTDAPDTAPIMAIYYSQFGGTLQNTQRLQYKESDRLHAIKDFLEVHGVTFETMQNDIKITPHTLNGGTFDTYNDHRITMSLIISSSISKNPVILSEIRSFNKSFPGFLEAYLKLGGLYDEE